MSGIDYTWLTDQLDALGYSDDNEVNSSIKKTVVELFHTLDAQNIDAAEDKSAAVDLFHSLVADHNLFARKDASSWTEFNLGVTQPGDVVRVRAEAYEGAGAKHNGLVGTISAMRGGRVLVKYTGRVDGVGHSHHPDKLEVLLKS